MAGNVRVYPLTFASAATSTNSVYVGNCGSVKLYQSAMTSWNAGVGNVTFNLLGGFGTENGASALTLYRVLSATIQTDISGGVYNWPVLLGVGGIPRLAVEFGTAVTGGAANTIYLMVSDQAY